MKKKSEKEVNLKLKPIKFALAAGIIVAAITFLATFMAMLPQFAKITFITSIFYGQMGYSISTTGAFIGAIYSFIDTFILAFIFAWLYNKFL